jgi:cation diffusion facilitator family transporter
VFCGVELVGGIWSDSLAILTDAAHQFSDVAGFVISFIAICLSTSKGNARYSYGYHRADVLGALGSIMIIWALLIWLLVEAINRLKHYKDIEINGDIMLITACIGLGCNILNLILLQFCMNDTDVKGRATDFRSSIASAYKYKGVGGLRKSLVLQDEESKPKE